MATRIDGKYVPTLTKMIYNALASGDYTEHALDYKERYADKTEQNRIDHGIAKSIIRAALKSPERSRIAISGYVERPQGLRYMAYVCAPSMIKHGVVKVVTTEAPYPPEEGTPLKILTIFREPLTQNLGHWIYKRMPIAKVLAGDNRKDFMAVGKFNKRLQWNYQYRRQLDERMYGMLKEGAASGQPVPFDRMKEILVERSKINLSVYETIQDILKVKPDYRANQAAPVNPVPDEEYDAMVRNVIETGVRRFDQAFLDNHTQEEWSVVEGSFNNARGKVYQSIPQSVMGITESGETRMESIFESGQGLIESICREAGCEELSDALGAGYEACCESIGDTVRGLFGKKKKPEAEEPQDEFFIRPYGGPIHQPNRYPGLIWSILGAINCDYDGKITKEQALGYIKRLIPAIKDNPDMPAFEKTLYRVVNAIELPCGSTQGDTI